MGGGRARRVAGLPGRRNEPRPIAAIAASGFHLHGVAQRVPDVTGIHAIVEGLIGGAAIEFRQHHLAAKGSGILRPEYGVEEGVELPEAHSAPGGEKTVAGTTRRA